MKLRRGLLVGTLVLAAVPASAAPLQQQQGWRVHGPFGGTVTEIEIDPRRPSIMYAGTGNAGVFKSTNGGRGWTRVSAGLPVNSGASELELAPSDSSVIYLKTGYRLYRSDDGARSWRDLSFRDPGVEDLAVDPLRAHTVYGAARDGLLRSTDGGATWGRVGLSGPDCIAIAPSAPNVMYGEDYGLLMRSADWGVTWTRMSQSLSCSSGFIAVDPRDPNTVYFTSADGIQKSTDGGAGAHVVLRRFGISTSVMAIDPVHRQRLYVATQGSGIFRSLDGGASWTNMTRGFPRFEIAWDVEVAPTASAPVYAGLYHRGILKSDGVRWRPQNNGLVATHVETLAAHPRNPNVAYAGLFKGGVAKTTDGGRTWRPCGLAGEIVFDIAIDPQRPQIVYAAAGDLFRSSNGGRTWKRRLKGEDRSFISVAVAPSMPRVVYAGKSERGLWHSFNGGRTWRAPELRPKDTVWSIAVHPRRPLTVWAGVTGSVVKSLDGGVTWQKPGEGLPEYMELWDLVVHPTRPRILYAGVELGGVSRSTDAGATWARISEGLPSSIHGIAIDPRRPRTMYVGGHSVNTSIRRPDGVWRTTNGGRSWTDLSAGMTTNWVASLALNRGGTRLYAGTGIGESGGGVFATRVR